MNTIDSEKKLVSDTLELAERGRLAINGVLAVIIVLTEAKRCLVTKICGIQNLMMF